MNIGIRANQLRRDGFTRFEQQGISLLELMIALAIVAILTAIAYPSYQEQIRKSRRTDARTALLDLGAKMERYAYANSGSYGGATVAGLMGNTTSPDGYYGLTIAAPTAACPIASCYQVTATPVAGKSQASDSLCQSFTLTSADGKLAQDSSAGNSSAQCW